MRRQPVEWIDAKRLARRSLAASLGIVLPTTSGDPAKRQATNLVLLAEWAGRRPEPMGLWLTNLADVSPAFLVRLSKLVHRVARDFSEVCKRVGIQDFEGWSFRGWHRHATLASVAHAVVVRTQHHLDTRPATSTAKPDGCGETVNHRPVRFVHRDGHRVMSTVTS